MATTWSKLKKTLSLKSPSGSSSQNPPLSSPNQLDSGSPVVRSPSSSSSFSARLSRSLSSSRRSSKKICTICLGNIKAKQGQAIFTAECSHTFHFSCIANSVKHGNYSCPICRCQWKEIPFQMPNISTQPNVSGSPLDVPLDDSGVFQTPFTEPSEYYDDEPLLAVSADMSSLTSSANHNNVIVRGIPEFPSVVASESLSSFAVVVGVKAPPILDDARRVERAPIDLVAVLDVSGSMMGPKLELVKQAVCFVIENLGPCDRLSIVSFSASAQRIFPLRRMTNRGREDAKLAVDRLFAVGGTSIAEGLEKGTRVLEERSERNPVASIVLLSDGRDNYYDMYRHLDPDDQNSRDPRSLLHVGHPPAFPIHTFGFGFDHDSSLMHDISDASGGTFSFIESFGMVQDGFARCIGGLLSVVAQELKLTVMPASPGIEIGSIPSGRYVNEISEGGSRGVITVGDLYADEEKEFLVNISIPVFAGVEGEEGVEKISILEIMCSYKDPISDEMIHVEGERVEIRRPKTLSPTDLEVSIEVDRQRNRLWVAEDIALAQQMAEIGDIAGAQSVLTNRRLALLSSASVQAGDSLCNWLEAELIEIGRRMMNMETYDVSGRAYVLSELSSHSYQRATTVGDSTSRVLTEGESSSNTGAFGYDTPSMVRMISKSQNLTSLN